MLRKGLWQKIKLMSLGKEGINIADNSIVDGDELTQVVFSKKCLNSNFGFQK